MNPFLLYNVLGQNYSNVIIFYVIDFNFLQNSQHLPSLYAYRMLFYF